MNFIFEKLLPIKSAISSFVRFSLYLINIPFLFSWDEFKFIDNIRIVNRKRVFKWIIIGVLLNLIPFIFSLIIEYVMNPSNMICFLNNGSLPILSFSIIATNLTYLLENMSDLSKEREEFYDSVKTKIQFVSICIFLISSVLFIFQSNFLNSFSVNQLYLSSTISFIIVALSISAGKKMFLLQNKHLKNFDEQFKEQMNALSNPTPNNYGVKF